jgi:hypothetical protein
MCRLSFEPDFVVELKAESSIKVLLFFSKYPVRWLETFRHSMGERRNFARLHNSKTSPWPVFSGWAIQWTQFKLILIHCNPLFPFCTNYNYTSKAQCARFVSGSFFYSILINFLFSLIFCHLTSRQKSHLKANMWHCCLFLYICYCKKGKTIKLSATACALL